MHSVAMGYVSEPWEPLPFSSGWGRWLHGDYCSEWLVCILTWQTSLPSKFISTLLRSSLWRQGAKPLVQACSFGAIAHSAPDPHPRNQNPQPELEEGEFIETFTVPLDKLWEECERLDSEGFAIDARVGTLAQGLEVAKKWRGALLKTWNSFISLLTQPKNYQH